MENKEIALPEKSDKLSCERSDIEAVLEQLEQHKNKRLGELGLADPLCRDIAGQITAYNNILDLADQS